MLVKYDACTLDFTPVTPIHLLNEQANYMGNYLRILEIRAEIENIKCRCDCKKVKHWHYIEA